MIITMDWRDYLILKYIIPSLVFIVLFLVIVAKIIEHREKRIKKRLEKEE